MFADRTGSRLLGSRKNLRNPVLEPFIMQPAKGSRPRLPAEVPVALSCGLQKRPWAAEAASPPALFYLDRNTTRSGANGSIRATYRSGSAAGGGGRAFLPVFQFLCWIFFLFSCRLTSLRATPLMKRRRRSAACSSSANISSGGLLRSAWARISANGLLIETAPSGSTEPPVGRMCAGIILFLEP